MTNPLNPQQDPRSLRDEALIFAKELAPRIDPMVGPFDPLVFGYEAGVLAERMRNANAILLEATAQEQDEISVHLLDSNMDLLNENNHLLNENAGLKGKLARIRDFIPQCDQYTQRQLRSIISEPTESTET